MKMSSCSICEFQERDNGQLRKHINTKHGQSNMNMTKLADPETEFNCMDCDFQTTSEEHLRNHIELKHIIRCKICGKDFRQKSNLI